MRYSNLDYNVVYVDPSIETAGDGSTPATALADLPAIGNFVEKTAYIIRRTSTEYCCSLPNGTNNSMYHILLIGMPLSTDPIYKYIPAVAKTAWDADTAERANIKSSSYTEQMYIPNLKTFLFHRINLIRSSSVSIGSSFSAYMIRLVDNNSNNYSYNYKGSYTFDYCRFAQEGYDIDSLEYSGNYNKMAMTNYLSLGYCCLLNIRHCIINYSGYITYSGAYGNGIYIYGINCFNFQDCNVNVISADSSLTNSGYHGGGAIYVGNYNEQSEVNISNLSIVYDICSNPSSGYDKTAYGYAIQLGGAKTLRANSISITSRQVSSSVSTVMVFRSMINFGSLGNFTIKNLTCQIPEFYWLYGSCISMNGMPNHDSLGYEREISDVSIAFGINSNFSTYTEYVSENRTDNYVLYADFTTSVSNVTTSGSYRMPIIKNITVKNYRGNAINIKGCKISNATLEGGNYLYGCLADITSISLYHPKYALGIDGCSTVNVGTINVNLVDPPYEYTEYPAIRSFAEEGYNAYVGNVYVETINSNLCSTITGNTSGYNNYAITCANNGSTGHYTMRTYNYLIDTWNVYRTGGSSACLKMTNTTYEVLGKYAVVGHKPFKGMCITPTQTGKHILKVHCAFKGYSSLDEMSNKFFITATTNESGAAQVYNSSVDGQWVDDSEAVWNNDSDLTQLRLELPVNVTSLSDPVDVRVYFGWYSTTGFIYLDPTMELVPESN